MEKEQRLRLAGLINSGNEAEVLDELRIHFADQQDVDFHFLSAIALQRLHRWEEAEQAYLNVLRLNPDAVISRKNLALLYQELGKSLDVAERLFSEYLNVVPHDLACLRPYYNTQLALGKTSETLTLVKSFRSIHPSSDEVKRIGCNAALVNRRYLQGLFSASPFFPDRLGIDEIGFDLVAHFLGVRAISLARQVNDLLSTLPETQGTTEQALSHATVELFSSNSAAAEAIYRRLLSDGHEEYSLYQNLAMMLLEQGRYEEGWEVLSHANSLQAVHAGGGRQKVADVALWRGEDTVGRTILVNPEQGMGDVIQFLRYIPILQATGARVVLNVYPDILQLLANDPRADEQRDFQITELPNFDFQTYLMDLPSRLRLVRADQIPWPGPYLFAKPEKVTSWRKRLSEYLGLRVAIAWAGNPDHHNDETRSAALEDFEPLAAVPGIFFFSIQKGAGALQAAHPPDGLTIVDLAPDIRDFSDTAAILSCVDLVISVDTSVVHLAGAMGVPVWVLLPESSVDYRWQLASETTPWYPSAQLFRQLILGDWRGLIRDVVRPALAKKVLSNVGADHLLAPMLKFLSSPVGMDGALPSPSDATISSEFRCWLASYLRVGLQEGWGRAAECWVPLLDADGAALVQSVSAERAWERGEFAEADRLFSALGEQYLPRRGFARWVLSLSSLGKNSEALMLAARGLVRYPEDHLILYAKAIVLQRAGMKKSAIDSYWQVVRVVPRRAGAWLNMARLVDPAEFEFSLNAYQRVLRLNVDTDQVWLDITRLAIIRRELGLAEFLARWLHSRLASPASALILGQAAALTGELDEARALLAQCEPLVTNEDDFLNGTYLADMVGDLAARERWSTRFSAQFPIDHTASYRNAIFLLANGNCREGWPLYAAGIDGMPPQVDVVCIPEWQGESLSGKRLVIYQDQGSGDFIQFAPLACLLPSDCEVTFAFPGTGLVELFDATRFAHRCCTFSEVDWQGGQFHYRLPIMRLPARLQVDLLSPPVPYPYIDLPARAGEYIRPKNISGAGRFNVGMVWAGASNYVNDAWRSTALVDWMPLLAVEGIRWISLQKDQASNQALGDPGFGLENVVTECNSFLDTAYLVSELDLLISVDSALAHLGGALGVPTWIVLPCVGTDWRWLRHREDCPWYPSVRLFRQSLGESWSDVFHRVAVALRQRLGSLPAGLEGGD